MSAKIRRKNKRAAAAASRANTPPLLPAAEAASGASGMLGKAWPYAKKAGGVALPAMAGLWLMSLLGGDGDREESLMTRVQDWEGSEGMLSRGFGDLDERRFEELTRGAAAPYRARRTGEGFSLRPGGRFPEIEGFLQGGSREGVLDGKRPGISPELERLLGEDRPMIAAMSQVQPRGLASYYAEEGLI